MCVYVESPSHRSIVVRARQPQDIVACICDPRYRFPILLTPLLHSVFEVRLGDVVEKSISFLSSNCEV